MSAELDELIGRECGCEFVGEFSRWPVPGTPAWVTVDAVALPLVKMRSTFVGNPFWINADQIARIWLSPTAAIAAEEARLAASKYPADGSRGWVVTTAGEIERWVWVNDAYCRARFDMGNWHATEADAIPARDRWAAVNRLGKPVVVERKLAYACVYYDLDAWDALTPEQRCAMGGEG